jgi:hypothetical protein
MDFKYFDLCPWMQKEMAPKGLLTSGTHQNESSDAFKTPGMTYAAFLMFRCAGFRCFSKYGDLRLIPLFCAAMSITLASSPELFLSFASHREYTLLPEQRFL